MQCAATQLDVLVWSRSRRPTFKKSRRTPRRQSAPRAPADTRQMAGTSGLLALLAALAASAIAMPCPVWCPPHNQGQWEGESAAPWQPLLLPPHWILVLVPGNIRLCPPHQLSAEAPVVAAEALQAATTGRPVTGETGLAVTKPPACPPGLEGLLCSLLSAVFTPCAGGQLGGAGATCPPQPSVTGSSKAPPAP